MSETIETSGDILKMLDSLLKEESKFNWDVFYSHREKGVPFFVNAPDENLLQHLGNTIPPGGEEHLSWDADRGEMPFIWPGRAIGWMLLTCPGRLWNGQRNEPANCRLMSNLFMPTFLSWISNRGNTI